ncbi:MAG: SDR family NAD(P)-dependent oxidoreductase, partial [Burkholderiales bacterium]
MSLGVQYNFTGSVVIISGAASGVGAATAWACATYGAKVIAIDVDAKGLAALQPIAGIETHTLDVADACAVDTLVADVVARHGRIDAAVLAAAVQARIPVDELSDAEWRRHMAVNLDGVFHIIRRVAPIMRAQRSGSLLAFTSGLVNMGWPGASA